MQATVIERLKQDDQELELFVEKLKKRGHFHRMKKILEKQQYLRMRLSQVLKAA